MITVDYRNRQPLYEQLVDNIRQLVLSGALEGDSQLPSVRQLSGELGINPNTVQKAYGTLEQLGVIYTVPGRGNFVRSDTQELRSHQLENLLREMTSMAEELAKLGVPRERIIAVIDFVYGEGSSK